MADDEHQKRTNVGKHDPDDEVHVPPVGASWVGLTEHLRTARNMLRLKRFMQPVALVSPTGEPVAAAVPNNAAPTYAGGMPITGTVAVGTTTPTVSLPVEIWDASEATRTPLFNLGFRLKNSLDNWDASGTIIPVAATNPAWKPLYAAITLAGGASVDTLLISKVAAKKFDVVVFHIQILAKVAAASPTRIVLTYQDEDNTAVAGHLTDQLEYLSAATALALGPVKSEPSFGASRFITTVANKDLEVDVSGGLGAEVVLLKGMYRTV